MSLFYTWRRRVLDLAGFVAKLPDHFPKQKGAVHSRWAAALQTENRGQARRSKMVFEGERGRGTYVQGVLSSLRL